MKSIQIGVGYGLLTSGVGGVEARWRDRWLSKAIVASQRRKMTGFRPTKSHAELITNRVGRTFGIRWRTRMRDNGLADYIGSHVLIASLEPAVTREEHAWAWRLAKMDELDGRIYPVARILMMGLTSTILPSWIDELSLSKKWAMCSEGTARYYHAIRQIRLRRFGKYYLRFLEDGWKGVMPGHLEQAFCGGDEFRVEFDGLLTEEILIASGLPTYRESGRPVALVPGD